MDALPFELHSQIFELACTDDGSTARALSRVSRYVRQVSQPFILQSVAVSGLASLTELADKIESLPQHRRRVRHLFLSDWTENQMQQKLVPSDDADMDRYEVERSAIVRVLDLVAPTLESLAFIVSCPFNSSRLIGHLFSLHFPRLEDLSVHGFYPFPHAQGNMPNLRRLHLSGNRNPHGLFSTGGLGAACPKLTHLRISGLVSAASFAEELENALLPVAKRTDPSLLSASLPDSICQVSVYAGPAPANTRRLASARAQHQKMSDRLTGLVLLKDSIQGVQFDLTEVADSEGSSYKSLRREWASYFIAECTS